MCAVQYVLMKSQPHAFVQHRRSIMYIYNNYLTKEETTQLQTKDWDKAGIKLVQSFPHDQ